MTPPDKDTREAMDELYAAELLYRHNLWRRGDDAYVMANPKELGIALDMAVKALRHRPKVYEAAKTQAAPDRAELEKARFALINATTYPSIMASYQLEMCKIALAILDKYLLTPTDK